MTAFKQQNELHKTLYQWHNSSHIFLHEENISTLSLEDSPEAMVEENNTKIFLRDTQDSHTH